MLLLALQTTTSTADDSSIDALTLVLVVIFIVSMAALSLQMRPRESNTSDESPAGHPLPEVTPEPPAHRGQPEPASRTSAPVWLQGVSVASRGASLSDAARLIEGLLAARQDHDLAGGMPLFTPAAKVALAQQLGIDLNDPGAILAGATFDGDPPTLRSIEIIEVSGSRMMVRATYSNRSREIYTLAHNGDAWLIDEITSHRG